MGINNRKAKKFLKKYFKKVEPLYQKSARWFWTSSCYGTEANFERYNQTLNTLGDFHNNIRRYEKIGKLLELPNIDPIIHRALSVAQSSFEESKLPNRLVIDIENKSILLEKLLANHRINYGGLVMSNNQLQDMYTSSGWNAERLESIWKALASTGKLTAPHIIERAKLNNKAAQILGYKNHREREIAEQELDASWLDKIFFAVEKKTQKPYKDLKYIIDETLVEKFGINKTDLAPWHYTDSFLIDSPRWLGNTNINVLYEQLTKEKLVEITIKFFSDIGMPIEDIINRSDLYERPGKDQHAFCAQYEQTGKAVVLANVVPNIEWMDTLLHEFAHAIYYESISKNIPYNLIEEAHSFITEGVALLFGALSKDPVWVSKYIPGYHENGEEIKQQVKRDQIILARWVLVMYHFEKGLYTDPEQDMDRLWWDCMARYQGIKLPLGDNTGSVWASKSHIATSPIYYHNYLLGEIFSAALRKKFREIAGPEEENLCGPNRYKITKFLKEQLFYPGDSRPWDELLEEIMGEKFGINAFVEEIK